MAHRFQILFAVELQLRLLFRLYGHIVVLVATFERVPEHLEPAGNSPALGPPREELTRALAIKIFLLHHHQSWCIA